MLVKLFIYCFLAYGITNIGVFGSIFKGWRDFWDRVNPGFFGKLFSCMMCLPFWVGVALSYFVFSLTSLIGIESAAAQIFLDGCLTSGIVWFMHTVQEAFERHHAKDGE